MADNFNVKNYLRQNKLGSYRLLSENYVDLHPIGEAPVKPTNIYNAEPNAWMDAVKDKKVGNWTVDYDYPGVLAWTMEGEDYIIYATPKWDGGEGTPIDLISVDHETIESKNIEEDEFASFEEYATTLLPHINAMIHNPRHRTDGHPNDESMPSWMMEDKDAMMDDNDDRIMGLGGDEIAAAVKFLLDDGFDKQEIIDWFNSLVNSLDQAQNSEEASIEDY